MMKKSMLALVFAVFLKSSHAFADVVVIAHSGVPKMDSKTVAKIYTGKLISVGGVNVTPVCLKNKNLRNKFLQNFVGLDEEKYVAYWTVRRYIGKGIPPRELSSVDEMIKYVQSTPGAIGYIDDSDLRPGVNVVAK